MKFRYTVKTMRGSKSVYSTNDWNTAKDIHRNLNGNPDNKNYVITRQPCFEITPDKSFLRQEIQRAKPSCK